MGKNRNMFVALPLTLLLILLAFFLPSALSQWQDRTLLDTPHIHQEAAAQEEFAESVRLTVPEKLLLLRSGDLSWFDLAGAEENTEVKVAIVDGEAILYESAEPSLGSGGSSASGEDAAVKAEAQVISRRLEAVQKELLVLRKLGGLPELWPEDAMVEVTDQREVLYIDKETQVSFTLHYMSLRCAPYTLSLTLDGQTGKILAFTLHWTRGEPPAWGLNGAASFGSAWRDYWGMDNVDASWRSDYVKSILESTEDLIRVNGDYTSQTEVTFSYDGQSLRVPLYCWAAAVRGCSIQWNT